MLALFGVNGCDNRKEKIVFRVSRDLSPGHILTAGDLEEIDMNDSFHNTSGISDSFLIEQMTIPGVVTEVDVEEFLGKGVKSAISKGDLLSSEQF